VGIRDGRKNIIILKWVRMFLLKILKKVQKGSNTGPQNGKKGPEKVGKGSKRI
jgi:hypothetical protein